MSHLKMLTDTHTRGYSKSYASDLKTDLPKTRAEKNVYIFRKGIISVRTPYLLLQHYKPISLLFKFLFIH